MPEVLKHFKLNIILILEKQIFDRVKKSSAMQTTGVFDSTGTKTFCWSCKLTSP